MLCQICKKRPAVLSYTQIINHKKTQLSVCSKCAEEKGITNPLAGLPEMFGKFLASIIGEQLLEEMEEKEPRRSSLRCAHCNLSLQEFEKSGLLGCPECYHAFEKELRILLRRIHGSNKHIGSRPGPCRVLTAEKDLHRLRQELARCVSEEKFERAAELRNLIRDAEREANRKAATYSRKHSK